MEGGHGLRVGDLVMLSSVRYYVRQITYFVSASKVRPRLECFAANQYCLSNLTLFLIVLVRFKIGAYMVCKSHFKCLNGYNFAYVISIFMRFITFDRSHQNLDLIFYLLKSIENYLFYGCWNKNEHFCVLESRPNE